MKMQITLRSGAQMLVDVEEFSTGQSTVANTLTRLDWTTPANWGQKLHTLIPTEVVAIVAIREPSDEEA